MSFAVEAEYLRLLNRYHDLYDSSFLQDLDILKIAIDDLGELRLKGLFVGELDCEIAALMDGAFDQ